MSERGVFGVDRGIWEHPLLDSGEFSRREAWLWLVSEAAWKARRVRVGALSLDLQRGELAHSLRFMAEKWGWTEPRVRRFLGCLKTDAMIETTTDAGITVISICNYARYQRVSMPSDAPADAPTDAVATQERRKEEGNKHKEDPSSLRSDGARAKPASRLPENWEPTPADLDFAKNLLPHDQVRVELDKFRDHWRAANGPPSIKRDWSAAWRNWCRKAVEINGYGQIQNRRSARNGTGKRTVHEAAADQLEQLRALNRPAPSDLCDGAGEIPLRRISSG